MNKDKDDNRARSDNASDIEFVQALAQILRDNDLGELQVERCSRRDTKLSVRISTSAPAPVYAAPAPQPAAAAPAPATAEPASAAPARGDDPAGLPGAVTSPMVGTVYLSPEPGTAAFVKLGDTVSEGQTLLIVEAMKTMNHIHAPKSGTIRRILVEDGAPVEYGAPLMVIE
ncbi:MAG: acetyl-CoA carboxylase biotin carboxyl carrier protein [Rhodobacteraceae bacterium]|nr:acetyl-CoA carboxylase biotin carboxyl carrier protein [Paracoccaceae bacterium]